MRELRKRKSSSSNIFAPSADQQAAAGMSARDLNILKEMSPGLLEKASGFKGMALKVSMETAPIWSKVPEAAEKTPEESKA